MRRSCSAARGERFSARAAHSLGGEGCGRATRTPALGVGPLSLAVLSGVLFNLAYPPFDLWPLAFLSLAPLLVALRGRSPRQAFVLGGIQGLATNVVGCTWMPSVIRTFGELPWVVCALIALVVCLYSAGRAALFGWLSARAERKGWPLELAFILAFCATEALYPLLFPCYAAGQVSAASVLMQLAELGGPVLVGVPLVMASTAAAELAWARRDGRGVDVRRVSLALVGPAAMVVFGAWRIPLIERQIAAAPTVNVGLVQGNVPHGGVSLSTALAIHRDATKRLLGTGKVDLVVWPETALSGAIYDDRVEATLRGVADDVNARGPGTTAILAGTLLKRGANISNAAVLFSDRHVRGIYEKIHPLAFGEYIPLGGVFPALHRWIPNAGNLTAGTNEDALALGEHRISPLICYEDLLASDANHAIRHANPDLLVNLTNDSWFGDSPVARVHFALAKFRAVEHRRYLVRATNSGFSAFVDPVGRATGLTAMSTEATEVETVRWMRSQTLYEQTGDVPWWCAALVVVAMGIVSRGAVAVRWRGRPPRAEAPSSGQIPSTRVA